MSFDQALQLIDAGGTVAFAIIIAVMFFRGDIVSRAIVDRLLQEAENRTDKLAHEIQIGIKDAVKDGIVAGVFEVRNGKGEQ